MRSLVAVVAVALTAVACGNSGGGPNAAGATSNSASTKPLSIRIGWQPDPDAPLYLARAKGLFQKNGLNPTFVTFESAPPMFSSLKANAVDVADMGVVPYSIGLSQGIDVKALMTGIDVSATNALVARAGINSISDLRGKTVAVTVGASPYLLLEQLLKNANMTMSDIHLVNMQVGQMIPAWKHGDVDAVLAWSPWIFEFPGGHIVTSMASNNIYAPQYWAARTAFIQSDPVAAQRFVNTIAQAIGMLHSDPSAAEAAMASQLSVSQSLAKTLLEKNSYPEVKQQIDPTYVLSFANAAQGKGAAAATQKVIGLLAQGGFIKTSPNAASSFDATFVKKAAS